MTLAAEKGATVRCAREAAARDEPMIGTASRVHAWVLLEQPGPWGREALIQSRLDEGLGRALARLGRQHRARVLLIRRPGWRRSEGPLRAYVARSAERTSWLEALDLDGPEALLDLDWSVLRRSAAPQVGRAVTSPLYLVCTNGQHDPCCADLGRPLVRALAAGGIDVWESSHVGGDRFAGNLVCLPEGIYLGRVGPDEGLAIVADYEAGLLPLERYRGRSYWSPLVQAAELFARRTASGTRQLHGVRLEAVEEHDDDHVVTVFDTGATRVRVRVSRHREQEAELLTCDAGKLAHPWRYALDAAEIVVEG